MSTFWKIIGVLLLGWAAWDVYYGYTVLYETVYRSEEPVLYWTTVSAWALLGLSCFWSWNK